MCVICHKPVGKELPSDESIDKMFKQNPDGAGFAIQSVDKNGKCDIEYWKGFMTVEDFKKAIHSHGDLTNKRVVMHFRIKTSGKADAHTTHPFKMSSNFKDLRELHGKGSVLFHNGVFSGLGGIIDELSSDTQDFVIGVAMHYLRHAKQPNKIGEAIAKQIIGSCRVIILYPNAKFSYIKYGTWTTHTDGCEYSNMLWNTEPTKYDWSKWEKPNYSHYATTPSDVTSYKDINEFGCNVAKYAWPSYTEHWINAGTRERFDMIKNTAEILSTHDSVEPYSVATFKQTGNVKWYLFPLSFDIVAEDHLEQFKDYQDMLEEMYLLGVDPDDEIIEFEDEYQMSEFFMSGDQVDAFTYRVASKLWYLDTINLVAYTEKGIKEYFPTGEQGHVKRYMREYGVADKYMAEGIIVHDHKPTIKQKEDDEDDMDIDAIFLAHSSRGTA